MFRNVMVVLNDLCESQRALELAIELVVQVCLVPDDAIHQRSGGADGKDNERRIKPEPDVK
jgi:hypothetical protein